MSLVVVLDENDAGFYTPGSSISGYVALSTDKAQSTSHVSVFYESVQSEDPEIASTTGDWIQQWWQLRRRDSFWRVHLPFTWLFFSRTTSICRAIQSLILEPTDCLSDFACLNKQSKSQLIRYKSWILTTMSSSGSCRGWVQSTDNAITSYLK